MTNTRLVQSEIWQKASTESREAFLLEMKDLQYGAGETLDAWLWFYSGWLAMQRLEIDRNLTKYDVDLAVLRGRS